MYYFSLFLIFRIILIVFDSFNLIRNLPIGQLTFTNYLLRRIKVKIQHAYISFMSNLLTFTMSHLGLASSFIYITYNN